MAAKLDSIFEFWIAQKAKEVSCDKRVIILPLSNVRLGPLFGDFQGALNPLRSTIQ